MLAELRKSGVRPEEEYDLLIVGGGATGAGVAVDAASRGLKVALVERDDFSAGKFNFLMLPCGQTLMACDLQAPRLSRRN
jgi:NADPH-dependent 2,4-dienoyl-CoA reductase/sulfur reductase-like enzyme